jgi:hypothetical protein
MFLGNARKPQRAPDGCQAPKGAGRSYHAVFGVNFLTAS